MLAARLSSCGHRVLLLDADPQGNSTATQRRRLEEQLNDPEYELEDKFKETLDILSVEKAGFTWLDFVKDRSLKISDIVLPVSTHLDLVKSRFNLARLDREILMTPYRFEDVMLNKLRPKQAEGISKIVGGYDFVIIDCCPSLSPVVASIFIASDKIILPIKPDLYSMGALEENLAEYEMLRRILSHWLLTYDF